uniref:Uncharacterized protein n=1 Tax=Hordeum vulgare subsp. vulgare TaxID=112509 RepID=A0A8I6WZ79_HORVV
MVRHRTIPTSLRSASPSHEHDPITSYNSAQKKGNPSIRETSNKNHLLHFLRPTQQVNRKKSRIHSCHPHESTTQAKLIPQFLRSHTPPSWSRAQRRQQYHSARVPARRCRAPPFIPRSANADVSFHLPSTTSNPIPPYLPSTMSRRRDPRRHLKAPPWWLSTSFVVPYSRPTSTVIASASFVSPLYGFKPPLSALASFTELGGTLRIVESMRFACCYRHELLI